MKVFIRVMDLVGPQNSCIGMGQALHSRGHQVHFLINEQLKGKFSRFAFVEHLLREDPDRVARKAASTPLDPIEQICDSIIKVGLCENISSFEKMKRLVNVDFFEELYLHAAEFEPQIKALLEAEKPDLIIIDCDIVSPCLLHYPHAPWMYLYCSNPIGFFDSDQLPPFTSGYPTADRSLWAEFRAIQKEIHDGKLVQYQRKLATTFGYPFTEGQRFVPKSPHLNTYQFPEELDYHDLITIPKHCLRVDAYIRKDPAPFELPVEFRRKITPGSKLIFLSMGSMGSIDTSLMKRLVGILAATPHFYIVSKGLLADRYQLADNMWGEAHLPQTNILPLVDLAIIHGGNNSMLEAMSSGVPCIIMPLFYDQ
ncbi:hypothetical protein TYRP_021277 [Tyrophagus putrescentiae]|nr:hypothetical protein TYRP_021277 [Tyrophagus putrescentiae]